MSLLSLENLKMHYFTREGAVKAVDGVSLKVRKAETFGLVGESGCGKTSVAMSLLKLLPENAKIIGGRMLFRGVDLVKLNEEEIRKVRWREISIIFQGAMNVLNPVYPVAEQIVEAMQNHNPHLSRVEAKERISQLFEMVGLDPAVMDDYPHRYSGGMRQRAVIAMAFACDPKLVIADEPTTALDVIVQDRILANIKKIQKALRISMLYISHDISVIAEVCDRIGIMYAGKLVECADTLTLFRSPLHPYTYALIFSFPSIRGEKKKLKSIPGEPPSLLSPPPGCRFHPRCSYSIPRCQEEEPPLIPQDEGHQVACWNPLKQGR